MITRYPNLEAYCATPAYQSWLAQWRPDPAYATMDVWHDTETQMRDQNRPGQRVTPRQHARQRHATRLGHHLVASMGIRDRCVDIGCGDNWFRHTHPGWWGVDPHHEAHRHERLTADWWRANWGRWPHAFTCCAIHYCDQDEIHRQIAKVRGLLRPGGTAVIALNRQRIQDHSRPYDEARLYHELCQTPGMTHGAWFDTPQDSPMDGNLWIWLGQ